MMALRPEDFTNHEMRMICLVGMQAKLGLEIHAKRLMAIATNTRDGFFIGSYAGPKWETPTIERVHDAQEP
jgi:hypothetical protein